MTLLTAEYTKNVELLEKTTFTPIKLNGVEINSVHDMVMNMAKEMGADKKLLDTLDFAMTTKVKEYWDERTEGTYIEYEREVNPDIVTREDIEVFMTIPNQRTMRNGEVVDTCPYHNAFEMEMYLSFGAKDWEQW
jgi:hypothetical protein